MLMRLCGRVPAGPVRERLEEAWRGTEVLANRKPAPAELADVQVEIRDAERTWGRREDRPTPWLGAELASAAELVARSEDFAHHNNPLKRSLDSLLDPDEIAHELRSLGDMCEALACSDASVRESICLALGHEPRRLAARVERVQPRSANGVKEDPARRYVVVARGGAA